MFFCSYCYRHWGLFPKCFRIGNAPSKSSKPTIASSAACPCEPARISVGGEIGYLLTTATATSTLQSVAFLTFGVVLEVTPIITEDGQVLMTVAPQVSTGRINPTSKLPDKESTEVTTTALLADGQAFIIGGLIKETSNDSQNKVPFFGDLWVVGKLFQSRDVLKERNEIIITLLPRIARPGDYCSFGSEEDYQQATTPLLASGSMVVFSLPIALQPNSMASQWLQATHFQSVRNP